MKFPLLIVVALSFSRIALSCSCIEPPKVAKRLEQSSTTFLGKAISKKTAGYTTTFTFTVIESFKGKLPTTVKITTASDSAACGANFTIDHNYIVFCDGDTVQTLSTNLCNANISEESEDSESALKVLRKHSAKRTKAEQGAAANP